MFDFTMDNIYLAYGLLLVCVLLSGLLVIPFQKQGQKSTKLLLAFSGGYLLAICFLHLVPEIYAVSGFKMGLFVLLGFLIQLFLEFLSQGIEHGHVHVHSHTNSFPYVVFISLSLHAFIEGMPIESELHPHANHDGEGDHSLLLGVVFHKIPISIALMTMLLQSGISKGKAILFLILFALMAPLGVFANLWFGNSLEGQFPGYFTAVLAVVVGMLLHIATTILFETSEGHGFNFLKFVSIITGGAIAYFTLL